MANAIKPLRPLSAEKAMNRVVGSGPNFPFTFSSTGRVRSVEVSEGVRKINQSIHTILSTRRGERMMLPEFGCFTGDTEILLITGQKVPIASLVNERRVVSFGTSYREGTVTQPPKYQLMPAFTQGAVSRGVKNVVEVEMSSGDVVRCTPDHLFLLSDFCTYVPAGELSQDTSLAWVDKGVPGLGARINAWKKIQRTATLCDLPMSKGVLKVVRVTTLPEPEEVFDLPNSSTENYALACGCIVHNSNLERLVFEPNDEILLPQLEIEVEEALRRWEKRIQLTRVSFISPELMSAEDLIKMGLTPQALATARDNSWIGIFIEYIIKQMHVRGSYVYPFVKDPMPMSETVGGRQ